MNEDLRDKAIAGMTAHLDKKCETCPYNGEQAGCIDRMLRDAVLVIIRLKRVEDAIRAYLDGLREGA